MSGLKGTNIAAPVVPFTDADAYPTHDSLYGKGGYREVATIVERDGIPAARLKEGCLVYVKSEDKEYRYKDGEWKERTSGGSGGASTLGGMTNVDDTADTPVDGAILIAESNKWTTAVEKFIPTGVAADGTAIKTFPDLVAYIEMLMGPSGVQRNIRINNDLDSKNVSASKGEPCLLKFTFVSQERYSISKPYEDTGERGLCQISIKNTDNADFTIIKQLYINSGSVFSFDCAEFLTSGTNNIMIKVTGEVTGEATPAFVYTVQLTSLSIAANNFPWWTAYASDFNLPLNIGGNVSKTLYVTLTGENYRESYQVVVGTGIYTETAYNYQVKHPNRTGVFNLTCYVSNSDGTIKTRTLSFNVLCVVTGAQKKLIVIIPKSN